MSNVWASAKWHPLRHSQASVRCALTESEVLVHWALAEDIRSLKRVKDAIQSDRPMPMALRENRVWGAKEKLYERVLSGISEATLAGLLDAAQKVDGIVKGLKQADWPLSGAGAASVGWDGLQAVLWATAVACCPAQPVRRPASLADALNCSVFDSCLRMLDVRQRLI